jgi:CRP/FNR family transcriptional regulator
MGTSIQLPSATTRKLPEEKLHAASECRMCGAQKSCLSVLFHDTDGGGFEGIVTGRRRVGRDSSLYREGDVFSALFAVRFGQFKSTRRNSSGGTSVSRFYMGGDLIGLDAIAAGRYGFRLTALENSEVCEISFPAITKTMAAQPKVLRRFLELMSAALNDQVEHSSMLSKTSLDERFASFLLELGAKYERRGYSGKSFLLGMTRADIGSYLGITVESVSRLISRFNTQSAVSISGRTVEIYDHDYLRAMLAGHSGKYARVG